MLPLIGRFGVITSRAHMIIWNRSKRVPQSLGFETKGGKFEPMIKKGWPLGVSVTATFTTAEPDQSSIMIKPFQGEKSLAARNKELGVFDVTEIPPAAAGEPRIEVTFRVVDASGAFSITARDARTGRDLPVLQR
jgi:molecular chaperone DnaK